MYPKKTHVETGKAAKMLTAGGALPVQAVESKSDSYDKESFSSHLNSVANTTSVKKKKSQKTKILSVNCPNLNA